MQSKEVIHCKTKIQTLHPAQTLKTLQTPKSKTSGGFRGFLSSAGLLKIAAPGRARHAKGTALTSEGRVGPKEAAILQKLQLASGPRPNSGEVLSAKSGRWFTRWSHGWAT